MDKLRFQTERSAFYSGDGQRCCAIAPSESCSTSQEIRKEYGDEKAMPVIRHSTTLHPLPEGKVSHSKDIFGNARPREDVLRGRGIDYREMDKLRFQRKRSSFYSGDGQRCCAVAPSESCSTSQENRKEHGNEKWMSPRTTNSSSPTSRKIGPLEGAKPCETIFAPSTQKEVPGQTKPDSFDGARPHEAVLANRNRKESNENTPMSARSSISFSSRVRRTLETNDNKVVPRQTKPDPFAGARPREAVLADRSKKENNENTPWSADPGIVHYNRVRKRCSTNYQN
eukprot:7072730-Ditylum_brightwellii.AAC.1